MVSLKIVHCWVTFCHLATLVWRKIPLIGHVLPTSSRNWFALLLVHTANGDWNWQLFFPPCSLRRFHGLAASFGFHLPSYVLLTFKFNHVCSCMFHQSVIWMALFDETGFPVWWQLGIIFPCFLFLNMLTCGRNYSYFPFLIAKAWFASGDINWHLVYLIIIWYICCHLFTRILSEFS